MKYKFCIYSLFIFVSINSFDISAQENLPVPLKENSIYYEEVVKVDSLMAQKELFLKTKQWVAQNYVASANYNPIQFEDNDMGIITVRISIPEFSSYFFIHTFFVNVSCVGKIQVKDGRYKYTFSEFYYRSLGDYTVEGNPVKEEGSCDLVVQGSLQGSSKKLYLSYLSNINTQMQTVIESLKKALNEPVIDDF
jgi:hypothetical protein